MATNRELDILSRLLNPDRMEDELLDERSIEAETPLNPASPVTDEEASVAAANNVVEAFNAPRGIDRQIAGDIAKSPMAEAASLMPDKELSMNLQDLKTGEDETLAGSTTPDSPSERELMLQEYKDLIKQRKDLMTAKKPEQSTGDQVMNWLTAAGQVASSIAPRRAPIGDVQYWGDITKKQDAAARKEKLGQLEGLQGALKDYLSATKGAGKDGKSNAGKIYQTRSGLVQLDEEGKPVQLYKDPSVATYAQARKKSQALSEERFKHQKDIKGRLSDKEVETITDIQEGERILGDIDKMLQRTDVGEDLGPYASRIEEASKWMPFSERDEDFVKMQQLVGVQLADYVKSISGAAVSEQEAQRLLKNIPNMTDKPGEFKAKLEQFKEILEESRTEYLKNIGKQKSGAKRYLGEDQPSEETQKGKSTGPYGETVERGGKTYKWNASAGKYQILRK